MAPYELPSVLVPGWVGFGGATYWGGMPFTDYPNAYLGVVAVLLAIPAFLAGGAPRVFALVLAGLSLLIAFGRYFPLYGFLYDHLPLFNKFRVPVMVIILFQLAVALGTAWGWSAILPGGDPRAAEPRVRARRVGQPAHRARGPARAGAGGGRDGAGPVARRVHQDGAGPEGRHGHGLGPGPHGFSAGDRRARLAGLRLGSRARLPAGTARRRRGVVRAPRSAAGAARHGAACWCCCSSSSGR